MKMAPVTEGLYPGKRGLENPTIRLGLGILGQAFRDLLGRNRKSEKEWRNWREDARQWFFSEESGPGSLDWVSKLLQVEPGAFRSWIRDYENSHRLRQEEMARELFSSFRFRVQEIEEPVDARPRIAS